MKKKVLRIIIALCIITGTISLFNLSSSAATTHNINTDGSITISSNGDYVINGSGVATTNIVKVNSGLTAVNITINNVNIDVSTVDKTCAFDISGATVNLTLTGTNILKSGNKAGIFVPRNATITIDGTGSLETIGGQDCSGIGGHWLGDSGTINISGGVVTATGGCEGAGIGGGSIGSGGTINISGGVVKATGGDYAAGIGGGIFGGSGNINISGGTIEAIAGFSYPLFYHTEAIGGGQDRDWENSTISVTGTYIYWINATTNIRPTIKTGNSTFANDTTTFTGKQYVMLRSSLLTVRDFAVSDNIKIYNGSTQTATVQYTNGITPEIAGTITVTYKQGTDIIANPTNVGTYDIYVSAAGGTDCDALVSTKLSATLVIAKKDVAISEITTIKPGGNILLSATLSGYCGTLLGQTITFEIDGTSVGTGTTDASGVATYRWINPSAKTYSIIAKFAGDTNHNGTASETLSYEVNPPLLAVSDFVVSNNAKTYNGLTQTATIQYVSGITTETAGAITVTYKQGSDVIANPTNAGTYDIYISTAGGTDYGELVSTKLSTTLIIAKKDVIISRITTVKSGANILLSATLSGYCGILLGQTITFEIDGTSVGTGTTDASGVATYRWINPSAKTYSITAKFSSDTNHNVATSEALSYEVSETVAKATGATVSGIPTEIAKSPDSITITTVTNSSSNGQTVEYAISKTSGTTPTIGWQNGTTFNALDPNTTYYAYARTKENENYSTGTAQQSVAIITLPTPTYGILLDSDDPHDFGSVSYGYASQTPLTVTVTNIGNQSTGNLAVSLSSSNASSFLLSTESISSIALGSDDSFTIKPKDGLSIGTYTTIVQVSGAGSIAKSFNVIFTVTPTPTPAPIFTIPTKDQFNYALTTKTYNGKAQSVNVIPKSGVGKITAVYYNNVKTVPTKAGSYSVTVDVVAGTQYHPANKIALGTFTINKADLSKVKATIANIAWMGKQIKPKKFTYNGVSFAIKSNVTVKSYGKNKNISKGTIKITGKGNFTGTKTITFKIVPKKNSVTKINTGKRQMKIGWKKVSAVQKITKYEVCYRLKGKSKWTTKRYKSSASSAKITKLAKGKTYQVRIRSYKILSGVRYYSTWSATKTGRRIK